MLKKSTNRKLENRWLYVVLSMCLMVIYGTVYSWGVFRLPVEEMYGVGTTLSGLPYMTFLLVYAISMLVGGKLIGKYAPKVMLIAGGILISIGWILSSMSHSIVMLTIAYGGFIGFGVGISYGVPIYVIAKWFPQKKGMVIGLVLAGFGLSPLFTAPLGHWFIDQFGLKATFLYYGFIFGVMIICLSFLIRLPVESDATKVRTVEVNGRTPMIEMRSFKFAYICFFLGTLIGLTIIGLTSNIGRDLIGIEPQSIALMMVVFALFNGAGRPLFGWMTETYGPQIAMRNSYLLIGMASIGMLFASEGSVTLYLILFSLLWLNLGAWLAIAPIMTMKLYGMSSYSQNYGLMFTAYGLGAVVGVISSGLLIDLLNNYKVIFMLIIVLCVIGIFLSQKVVDEKVNKPVVTSS